MVGFVTTRDLLVHSKVILYEFGPRCLVRCFWRNATAHRPVTFLECVEPPQPRLGGPLTGRRH